MYTVVKEISPLPPLRRRLVIAVALLWIAEDLQHGADLPLARPYFAVQYDAGRPVI
jgi:hypothetical protein